MQGCAKVYANKESFSIGWLQLKWFDSMYVDWLNKILRKAEGQHNS